MSEESSTDIVEHETVTRALPTATASKQTPQMSISEVVSHSKFIQQVAKESMRKDVHYGVIPGTNKPSLYKSGAEYLCMTFKLAVEIRVKRHNFDDGHREEIVTCRLSHSPTGLFLGEGIGTCSTMESRYRWRKGSLTCPKCGEEAIIKGKAEYGGGFVCWSKKNGCGEKFADGAFTAPEREENPDIADQYNTVLKMAKKRALIDAVLTVTAASDTFTQDIEDMPQFDTKPENAPPANTPPPAAGAPPAAAAPPATELKIIRQSGNGKNVSTDVVMSIDFAFKSGTSSRGPWEKHAIVLGCGVRLETFSKTYADGLGEHAGTGEQVFFEWEQNQYGYELLNWATKDPSAADDEADAPPPREPGEDPTTYDAAGPDVGDGPTVHEPGSDIGQEDIPF